MKTKVSSGIEPLLSLLDEAYNKKSWHGTNLRGSIRGLSAAQAAWRTGHHSIADLVVHCAYWKYAARRWLRGDKRGSFPLKGSNWFALPDPPTPVAWRQYVALLQSQHAALRAAVAELSPGQLEATHAGSKVSKAMLIRGVAMHDVYHAGQIQTIKGVHKA
jgi:uncharacterized damage-inducible protein DinB